MKTTHKTGLPHGVGSIQLRRASLWLVYRDVNGATVNENSHTRDWGEATRLLAQRALPDLQRRWEAVARIAYPELRIPKPVVANAKRPSAPQIRATFQGAPEETPATLERGIGLVAALLRMARRTNAERDAKDGSQEKAPAESNPGGRRAAQPEPVHSGSASNTGARSRTPGSSRARGAK